MNDLTKNELKSIQELKKMTSSFVLEERERQEKIKEETKRKEASKKSVLERIKKEAYKLKETTFVEYHDPKILKKELNENLNSLDQKNSEDQINLSKVGRPKIDENLRAKNIRVTIKADLFNVIEDRKNDFKSRSATLCDILEKGLKYERLRKSQSKVVKEHLKEFAEIFSKIKIRHFSSSWRTSQINFEENEQNLARLYKKSLEIKNYLEIGEIDLINFSGIREYLTDKEITYLEFAASPEKMASIVKTEKEDFDE